MPASTTIIRETMAERLPAYADDDGDLLRRYETATQCLLQCESLIRSLERELEARDERVASLEAELVRMSLELASSKAREDEHRLATRRLTTAGGAGDNGRPPPSEIEEERPEEQKGPDAREPRSLLGRSWSVRKRPVASQSQSRPVSPPVTAPPPSDSGGTGKKQRSFPELGESGRPPSHQLSKKGSLDGSLTSSLTSRVLPGLGHLLGLRKGDAMDKSRGSEGVGPDTSLSWRPQGASQMSVLSGVVFPSTTREVLAGCSGPSGKAGGGRPSENSNEEWPEF